MLNTFFTRHLLTAEECSKVARDGKWMWEDILTVVLLTKPAGIVQEVCQVLEEHGSPVKKLNSKLCYSSTHACTHVSDMFSYTYLSL